MLKQFEKIENITDNEVVDCVIIYPNSNSDKNFGGRQLKEKEISRFTKFYNCGIQLPLKEQ
ncbi:MAG: hypothetical protein LBM67_05295 [Lentimicrobiaceae bacterium]|jgi:hypothetical protein|nr:hypothetical protein [Lentimicrobiaceae bacterium]